MFDTENRVPLGTKDPTFSRVLAALFPLFQAIGALPKGRYLEALAWGSLFASYVVHLRWGPIPTRRPVPVVVAILVVTAAAVVAILLDRFLTAAALAAVATVLSISAGIVERRRLRA